MPSPNFKITHIVGRFARYGNSDHYSLQNVCLASHECFVAPILPLSSYIPALPGGLARPLLFSFTPPALFDESITSFSFTINREFISIWPPLLCSVISSLLSPFILQVSRRRPVSNPLRPVSGPANFFLLSLPIWRLESHLLLSHSCNKNKSLSLCFLSFTFSCEEKFLVLSKDLY